MRAMAGARRFCDNYIDIWGRTFVTRRQDLLARVGAPAAAGTDASGLFEKLTARDARQTALSERKDALIQEISGLQAGDLLKQAPPGVAQQDHLNFIQGLQYVEAQEALQRAESERDSAAVGSRKRGDAEVQVALYKALKERSGSAPSDDLRSQILNLRDGASSNPRYSEWFKHFREVDGKVQARVAEQLRVDRDIDALKNLPETLPALARSVDDVAQLHGREARRELSKLEKQLHQAEGRLTAPTRSSQAKWAESIVQAFEEALVGDTKPTTPEGAEARERQVQQQADSLSSALKQVDKRMGENYEAMRAGVSKLKKLQADLEADPENPDYKKEYAVEAEKIGENLAALTEAMNGKDVEQRLLLSIDMDYGRLTKQLSDMRWNLYSWGERTFNRSKRGRAQHLDTFQLKAAAPSWAKRLLPFMGAEDLAQNMVITERDKAGNKTVRDKNITVEALQRAITALPRSERPLTIHLPGGKTIYIFSSKEAAKACLDNAAKVETPKTTPVDRMKEIPVAAPTAPTAPRMGGA